MHLRDYIRNIPDFPKPGIQFKDITPLLKSPEAFNEAIDGFASYCAARRIDLVAGIEARGFLLAAPLAQRLEKPLIPVRKSGKLPYDTYGVTYDLEYGEDSVEIHRDAVSGGQRVLVVDDLIATGGTAAATARLIEEAGSRRRCRGGAGGAGRSGGEGGAGRLRALLSDTALAPSPGAPSRRARDSQASSA